MTLLEKLPKEIKKIEFEAFLEKIKRDFPAAEFPEIFIHYKQMDDKILILGLGDSGACGEQALRAYRENPELKKYRSGTLLLRAPANRFCRLKLKLTLPDSLVREAQANGLLTPQSLELLLRAELRRRRVQNLFDSVDQLAAVAIPPLTETEVEAEIQAVRTTRRTSHASGG